MQIGLNGATVIMLTCLARNAVDARESEIMKNGSSVSLDTFTGKRLQHVFGTWFCGFLGWRSDTVAFMFTLNRCSLCRVEWKQVGTYSEHVFSVGSDLDGSGDMNR